MLRKSDGYFCPEPKFEIAEVFESVEREIEAAESKSADFTKRTPPCDSVAFGLANANIKKGDKVLEIGTGTGYITCLLSRLVGPEGKAISIEIHMPTFELARKNINLIGLKNVTLINGDGSDGFTTEAPFDAIWVDAGIILPTAEKIGKQLKEGSRIFSFLHTMDYSGTILWGSIDEKKGGALKEVRRCSGMVMPYLKCPENEEFLVKIRAKIKTEREAHGKWWNGLSKEQKRKELRKCI